MPFRVFWQGRRYKVCPPWCAKHDSSSQILVQNVTALLVLNYPDTYVFKSWHGTLLTIAILSLSVTFNTFFAQKLHLVVINLPDM